jgi:hypothetical protein
MAAGLEGNWCAAWSGLFALRQTCSIQYFSVISEPGAACCALHMDIPYFGATIPQSDKPNVDKHATKRLPLNRSRINMQPGGCLTWMTGLKSASN